ncbi:MAG: hypothetical protein GWM89_10575 [Candidatus Dadabacteria bacterium]|nr:GH3 auxin-responsive promoter family protein [Candidatus Dadabacteria bacterium]NIV40879.1 hypothetical protein [Candidatus Dadabacteria bacterium]NIX16218.1 hypothetical protein [Candidatus Dadabacteria bacterium]NIY22841.1 hypothetical protein [Candidatus Dadabacteria bacterium]
MIIRLFVWTPFIKKTLKPEAEQNAVLKSILEKNKDTVIGKKYGFADINSYEDYKKSVPVHTYEMLREFIEKQQSTNKPYLTSSQPTMYAQTSGTTDKSKLIPVLSETVKKYKKSQCISNYSQYMQAPSMFCGKMLAVVSPAAEGRLQSGVPYGSLSGLLYKNIPRIIRSKYVLPYEIFELEDYDDKYFLISVLSAAQKNLTTFATANPSTILKISEIINTRFDEIINIIENGITNPDTKISETGKHILNNNLCKNKARAEELRNTQKNNKLILLKDIWPDLKAVVTWKQGNCSLLIPKLRNQLSSGTKIFELGYLSSEFRGSVIIDANSDSCIPVIDENFYEFIERHDWDHSNKNFKTINDIEIGKHYYIIVTTPYGLYRYFINDIIEVTSKFNNTPTIKFSQKGRGVTNITGEKLYEEHILKALSNLRDKNGLDFNFFTLIANPSEQFYELFLESERIHRIDLSSMVDEELKIINVEYKNKRDSSRLKPIKLNYIKNGTGETFKKHCIKNGQRDSQFKFNHLMYTDQCNFNFNDYII